MSTTIDIRQLYDILTGRVSSGTLSLRKGDIPSQPIDAMFALLGDAPIELTGVTPGTSLQLNLKDNLVALTGAGGKSFPFAGTTVSGIFTIIAGVPQMYLLATMPDGKFGAFSVAFPKLQKTMFDGIGFGPDSRLSLASWSAAATIPQGLAFDGAMLLTAGLAPIRVLFNSDRMPVSGAIALDEQIPVFAWTGTAFGEVPLGAFGVLKMTFEIAVNATGTAGAKIAAVSTRVVSAILYTSNGEQKQLAIVTRGPFDFNNLLFQGEIQEAVDLGFAALSQLADGANLQGLLPSEMPVPPGVKFKTWNLFLDTSSASIQSVNVGVTIVLDWEIVPDLLTVRSLDFDFTVSRATGATTLAAAVTTELALGEGDEPGIVLITAIYPGFVFSGNLKPGTKIDLKTLATRFLGSDAADFIPVKAITKLDFSVDPASIDFSILAGIQLDWQFDVLGVSFTLLGTELGISRIASVLKGSILARFKLLDTGSFFVNVGAAYDGGPGTWTFSGALDGVIPVGELIAKYAPAFSSFSPQNLKITQLAASITTAGKSGTSSSYRFAAAAEWTIEPGGVALPITAASAALDITAKPGTQGTVYTGFVAGKMTFFGIDMGVKVSLAEQYNSYEVTFWEITAKLAQGELSFRLPNRTLGEIIELMLNAARPGENITLPAPFNVLNTIRLSDFEFAFNFNTKIASVRYPADGLPGLGLELGFMRVDQFELAYDVSGGSPSASKVNFSIRKGRFLDQTITPTAPKTFDATNPANMAAQVPGQGEKLFQLRFLAMGQHVSPKTPIPQGSTIATAVDKLSGAFKPKPTLPALPGEPGSQPGEGTLARRTESPALQAAPVSPISRTELQFDDKANWIVACDATILSTVTIKALFLDPELYGVSISLGGARAGKLLGLSVDILYRRVNENVGVYQFELTLPDYMRQLEFGQLQLTLPIIRLEIFTNGDFRVDFGFPLNDDFSRSFGVSYLPFTGAGGFYFGVMSGASSTKVPQITDGTFSPVLELGIGLRIGIGRSIDKGILKAGLSVTLQGIIEGAIAWFNPYSGDSKAFFYTITGKFQIVGEVYGQIDFAIISARLDIIVKIGVQLKLEIYQPVQFTFFASVTVRLSVEVNLGIFSFTVKLSFEAKLQESFTIGSKQTPPWTVKTLDASQSRLIAYETPLDKPQCENAPTLVWKEIDLGSADRREVKLVFGPQLTTASPVDETTGAAGDAKPQAVAMLYAETSDPETGDPDDPNAPFIKFAEGVFVWAVGAYLYRNDPVEKIPLADLLAKTITADDLKAAYCGIVTLPAGAIEPFTKDELNKFVEAYYLFSLRKIAASQDPVTVSVVPMIPQLKLKKIDGGDVDFSTFNTTGTAQLEEIKKYFRELDVRNDGGAADRVFDDVEYSIAQFLWMDFAAMLARDAVQAGIDALANATVTVDANDSLASIAEKYSAFGATVAEIASANLTRLVMPDANASLLSTARSRGEDPIDLAVIHSDRSGIFAPGKILIPNAASAGTVADLLALMESQGRFSGMSGLAARVLLAGLRPPFGTDETPTALFELSGQQFDVTGLQQDQSITLTIPTADWIEIEGSTDPNLPYAFSQTEAEIATQFTGAVLEPNYSVAPRAQQLYRKDLKRFTLANPIQWTGASASTNVAVWPLPANLQTILQGEHALRPLMKLVEQRQDAAHRPPITLATGDEIPHAWATTFPVIVRRIPSAQDPSKPLEFTYDFLGTGEADGVLLQNLLDWTNGDPSTVIDEIHVLFPPDPGQPNPPAGLVSAPFEDVQLFLVQTNLSTASNPGAPLAHAAAPEDETGGILGMSALDVVRLMWECSIVRSGGYNLYYRNIKSGSGLPSYLFEQQTDVTLTIVVTFKFSVTGDTMESFFNSGVLDQAIDPLSTLFLESAVQQVIDVDPRTPIATLARRHHLTVAELVELNRDRRISEDGFFLDTPVVEDALWDRITTVPPGNNAWEAERTPPAAAALRLGDAVTEEPAQSGLQQLYNLAAFRIAGDANFDESFWSIPAGPGKDGEPDPDPNADVAARFAAAGELWPYKASLPVAKFTKNVPVYPDGAPSGANDPYRGIGLDAAIDLVWLDTFGNRIQSTDGNPLKVTLPLRYFDNLLAPEAWSGVGADYVIDGTAEAPKLTVELNFDASPYQATPGEGPAPKDLAAAIVKTFELVYYQLSQDDVEVGLNATSDTTIVTKDDVAKTTLREFIASIYAFLAPIANGDPAGTPPPSRQISRDIKNDNPSQLYELSVTLTVKRTKFIAPALDDPAFPSVTSVTLGVRPHYTESASATADDPLPPLTLRQFAEQIETAFPGWKVATGTPERQSDGSRKPREIWLMHLAEENGVWFAIDREAPVFYAIAPLATSPESATAKVRPYKSGEYIGDATAVEQAFSNTDLEVIGRDLLSAIDQFLSPDYVTAAWKVLNENGYGTRPNAVDVVLEAKKTLARKISSTLIDVYGNGHPDPGDPAFQHAVEDVRQQLLIRLGDAYGIDTVLQYGVTVTSGFTSDVPSLFGKPVITDAELAETRNYSFTTTRFALKTGASSWITFAFSTRNEAEAAVVDLPLAVKLTNIQMPMKGSASVPEYQPSSWLTFVIPLEEDEDLNAATSLGTPAVPVPLRAYPTPPSMTQQTGTPFLSGGRQPSTDPITKLEEAKQWNYDFAYEYPPADQDTVYPTARFNLPSQGRAFARSDETIDRFTALVQFTSVYNAILADLNETLLAGGGDATKAVAAIRSFAYIANLAAEGWDQTTPRTQLLTTGTTEERRVQLREEAVDIDEETTGVLLIRVTPVSGVDELPFVDIEGWTREEYPLADPLAKGYVYKQGEFYLLRRDALLIPRRLLSWGDADVLLEENALGSAFVRRNEHLGDQPVNPLLIYETPDIRFYNTLTPVLVPDITLDLADYSPALPPPTLEDYLRNFFTAFFASEIGSAHTIKLGASFVYDLQPGAFPVTLPIFLSGPMTGASQSDWSAAAKQVADFVLAWLDNRGLRGKAGLVVFDQSLFAGAQATELPTLRLMRVQLDAGKIGGAGETTAANDAR